MTVQENLAKFKKIQTTILEFLEKNNDVEESFQNLIQCIELPKKGTGNQYDVNQLLHLLANIAENHFHEPDFYRKIEKLLLFLKDEIKENCTDSEIFNIFKNSKRVLLFLFEEKMIKMNNYIASQMQSPKYHKKNYPKYFFPEIKPFLKSKKEKEDVSENHLYVIANEYNKKDDFSGFMSVSRVIRERDEEKKKVRVEWYDQFSKEITEEYYENRKIGENTSKICRLIQQDLIDDFITYVERENYTLSSTIDTLYYETNSFLLNNPKTTLIEYASFYGSVQIFKYLFKNGVELKPSIWPYAIHSNNSELIHLLEDNKVEPESYLQVYNEAIRCHHNAIASYINANYLDKDDGDKKDEKNEDKNDDDDDYENEEEDGNDEVTNDPFLTALESYNFEFISEELINNCSFFNLCKYDYCTIVNNLIQQKDVNVNETQQKEVHFGYDDTYTEEEYVLHCAIENGNINIIKLLLTNEKLDLNCVKKYIAKKPKSKRISNFMLDYVIGTEWVSWDGWTDDYDDHDIIVEMTALNYAIIKENIDIINLLLEDKRLDINLFSKFSMESPEENYLLMTPLQFAVEKENIEVIRTLLLNENVDPNVISVALSNNPDGNGKHIQRRERTAFHIAIENGNLEIIKMMLENDKVDVNINRTWFSYRDEHEEWSSGIKEYEKSALHIAIYKANVDVVRLLLNDERIDVNHPQFSIKSDIYVDDADEWDSRRAPEENPTFKESYLWADIPNKWILSFKESKSEKTPLLFAVEFGNREIVGLLVDNEKVDINLRSKFVEIDIDKKKQKNENKVEEKTALYFAIENGKTELYNNDELVAILLKSKSIDINFPSKISNNPRQIGDDNEEEEEEDREEISKKKSKKSKQKAKAKSKAKTEADVKVNDNVKDITPLQIATEKDSYEIIKLLKNHKL